MIVDDDAMVTESIRTLLEIETDYRVLDYQNPVSALQALNEIAVDLIVSDFLMPEMNGLEFLSEVRKLYPALPCIMLTGYADKQNAIRAINEVGLYQYLEKPWDNDHLKMVIRNGLRHKSLEDLLQEKIRQLDEILRDRDQLMVREQIFLSELDLARRVQQSLFPASIPNSDNFSIAVSYQPSLHIGGDFYDILPLSDGRIGFFLADITGHGIQAALGTALLKFAFGQYSSGSESLAEIITGVNDIVARGLPANMLTAALAAIYDPSSGILELVNAGLPHPIIVRHASCEVERVPANGLLLGVAPGAAYRPSEPTRIKLNPGDCLLLYTDGLSEADNGNGEMFDDGHLSATLRRLCGTDTVELLSSLAKASLEFGSKLTPDDDTTLIAFRKL